MTSPAHHTLTYIEFGVTDLAATRAFYESAFGWQFNDYGPGYAGIRAASGDGEVGGLNPQAQPRTPARWPCCSPMTWTPP